MMFPRILIYFQEVGNLQHKHVFVFCDQLAKRRERREEAQKGLTQAQEAGQYTSCHYVTVGCHSVSSKENVTTYMHIVAFTYAKKKGLTHKYFQKDCLSCNLCTCSIMLKTVFLVISAHATLFYDKITIIMKTKTKIKLQPQTKLFKLKTC